MDKHRFFPQKLKSNLLIYKSIHVTQETLVEAIQPYNLASIFWIATQTAFARNDAE